MQVNIFYCNILEKLSNMHNVHLKNKAAINNSND